MLASPTAGEIAYLCAAANRYFREQFAPTDVVRTIYTVRATSARNNWLGGYGRSRPAVP